MSTQTRTATLFPGDGGSMGVCGGTVMHAWPLLPRPATAIYLATATYPATAMCPPPPHPLPPYTPMGTGIGPEIGDAMMAVVAAAGTPISWDVQYIGKEVDPRTNSFITRENLDSVLVRGVGHFARNRTAADINS
jgi:hypothetical protein